MKSRLSISENTKDFESNFKSLNNEEMNSLRGGNSPDLPTSGGEDFPIDPFK